MDKDNVKAHRTALGLTQAQYAQYLGVSVQTVQAWEQGRNPVPKWFAHIAGGTEAENA